MGIGQGRLGYQLEWQGPTDMNPGGDAMAAEVVVLRLGVSEVGDAATPPQHGVRVPHASTSSQRWICSSKRVD